MYLLGTFVVDGVPPEDQDDLDFFTFPTLDASIGNDALDAPIDGFCVSAAGDNQDAGKAFIKWLGSAEAADAGNNAASAPFIAANAGASTAKYGELQKKSAEVVQNAKSIAQFLDRDTRPDFASRARISAWSREVFTIASRSVATTIVVAWSAFWSVTFTTSTNLLSCFVTCSRTRSSPGRVMVMRESMGSAQGPTLRVSMLYPRPENSPTMRESTPGWFSTVALIMWFI